MTSLEAITKARVRLLIEHPFFGVLALKLTPREDLTCPTMWVNGVTLGYNPAFVGALPKDELLGVMAHEVMHIAFAHHLRRQERNQSLWNYAADGAVNPVVLKSGFKLPAGAVSGFKSTDYAEDIYNRLKNKGLTASNIGCGEVRDGAGSDGSEADRARAEAEVKIAVAQALQHAKAEGKLPGHLERLMSDWLEPRVDCAEFLRRFIEQSAKNDYQWFPPNRRYVHQGLYLPSVRSNELPEVVLAIDTSGSIGEQELREFGGIVSDILAQFETTCTVIYCDTRVTNVDVVQSHDLPLQLNMKGGGGTDFKPPFQWLVAHDKQPKCLLYLTDGYCSSFADEPDYPVLWVLSADTVFNPPYGEQMRMAV